jgi:hypothetical protein
VMLLSIGDPSKVPDLLKTDKLMHDRFR